MIQSWGLKKSAGRHPFSLYTGPQCMLVITGTGRLNAAAGCAYLQGLQASLDATEPVSWLNVGVAGHAQEELGTGFLMLKVTDAQSGRSWFPVWPGRPPCRCSELTTVSAADGDYRYATLVDMEAAAMMAVVSRFVTLEFVHCYKVVSDNRMSGTAQVTASRVSALVDARLPEIETLVSFLTDLSVQEQRAVALPRDYSSLLERYRFSFTQRQQLKKLLYQWQALTPAAVGEQAALRECRSAGQLLAALQQALQQLPVHYGDV